jgi:hypothetical protein
MQLYLSIYELVVRSVLDLNQIVMVTTFYNASLLNDINYVCISYSQKAMSNHNYSHGFQGIAPISTEHAIYCILNGGFTLRVKRTLAKYVARLISSSEGS